MNISISESKSLLNMIIKKNVWLISTFSIPLLMVLLSGSIGLYSLSKTGTNSIRHINAIGLSKEVQIEFQKQFHVWKTIVLEGDSFDTYKKNFHLFSYHSTRIKDLLFNLKLLNEEYEQLPVSIIKLENDHKRITNYYMSLLVELEKNSFKNKTDIFIRARGRDSTILKKIDNITNRIMELSDEEIRLVNSRFYRMLLVSVIILMISAVAMSIYVARKIINGKSILEKKVRERTYDLEQVTEKAKMAAEQISVSEKKYRLLVEESNDMIFSLDSKFNFITVNKAITTHLRMQPEKILNMNFLDLLYNEDGSKNVSEKMIREKLEKFSIEKTPLRFRVEFKNPVLREPIEMQLSLEYINTEKNDEVLGKAVRVTDDALLNHLIFEKQKFLIGNYLITAEDITHRITWKLRKFFPAKDVNLIRVALREIIINAIEHGNLDITFNEKTNSLLNDNYFKFIASRRQDPRYRGKEVLIEYIVDSKKVIYRITDQGNGFDHSGVLKRSTEEVNKKMIPHGRGIQMAKTIFDLIKYNDKGNQVVLVKKIKTSALHENTVSVS